SLHPAHGAQSSNTAAPHFPSHEPQPGGPSPPAAATQHNHGGIFSETGDKSLAGQLAKAFGMDDAPPSAVEKAVVDALGSENIERVARATDAILPFVPVTGVAKDVYEAATGYNITTGERLTRLEQGMAAFGVLTLGGGTALIKGTEALSKVARGVEEGR